MLRKTLAIIVTVIIIVAAVAAIGYTQFIAPSGNARSIKIGLVAPMQISIGQDMWAAAQMAVKEINDAGGVYVKEWRTNVTITLVQVDTVKDADTTVANAAVSQAILVDGVDLLIGGYGSTATLSDEVIAINNKVPFIVTGASTPLITERGPQANYGGLAADDNKRITNADGMSYIFHYCTTTNDYSKTVVDFFANDMKPLLELPPYNLSSARQFRLAILYKNDAFGQGVVQSVNHWIQNESLPITIVDSLSVAAGTNDFTTQLSDIKSQKPDAVFVVNDPAYTCMMITQGQDQGLNTVYIAVENNEDPAFYSGLGSDGNKQLLESKFAPNVSPIYSSFVQSYVEKYKAANNGAVPGMMGADTYDAIYIAKAAIESAGTIDKASVRTAIETTDIANLLILTQTGKIEFSTGINYHEIAPTTFIQQLKWNATTSSFTTTIVYCTTNAAITSSEFVLPDGYQPGV